MKREIHRKMIVALEFIYMIQIIYWGLLWVFNIDMQLIVCYLGILLAEMLVIEIQLDGYDPLRFRKIHKKSLNHR